MEALRKVGHINEDLVLSVRQFNAHFPNIVERIWVLATDQGCGLQALIHRPTVVLYLSYLPATKFFDENSEISGVLIPV